MDLQFRFICVMGSRRRIRSLPAFVVACATCLAVVIGALPLRADEIAHPRIGQQTGEKPEQTLELPAGQHQPPEPLPEQLLIIPPKWQPTIENPLPPVPPALERVDIPKAFAGCWSGRPAGFDHVYPLGSGQQIGEPGEIIFCYREHSIEVPRAEVYIGPEKRMLDIALNLGLAHTTFVAHGVKTDIYSVNATMARGRTTLDIDPTWHFLHIIPVRASAQPSKVDWKATPIDSKTIHIEAYQVAWAFGSPSFSATWHADFKYIGDAPGL